MRRRLFQILWNIESRDPLSRAINGFLLILIVANVAAVAAETVEPWASLHSRGRWDFECFSVAVFSVEYLLRLWLCPMDPRFSNGLRGRLRYMRSPLALIDLASVLPFFVPAAKTDLRFLRIIRLSRILRLFKLTRYSRAMHLMMSALRESREQLILALWALAVLMVVVSVGIYYAEHDAQPEKFPNIPEALWWSVVTLTTVGYGDVYPITAFGKILAGFVAILGIGLFALPAGIVSSGLMTAMEEEKRHARPTVCPHCGEEIGFTAVVKDRDPAGKA